jgi:hypothetical protein
MKPPRSLVVAALLAASGCAPAAPPSPSDSGSPSAAASVAIPVTTPSTSAVDAGPFHCFSWAHERDFSTDCYRTEAACLIAAKAMTDGARLPTACGPRQHASCTTLRGNDERCFGDAANCARYRAFVGRNHVDTAECAPR